MPITIFCSYASKDQTYLDDLKKYFGPFIRQNNVTLWNDTDISAGMEWQEEIKKNLEKADIILLLISPDFMNSEYCCGIELPKAIERHNRGDARVIPILLRPVHWERTPISKFHLLPTNAKPITEWSNPDGAFLNVVENIIKVIKELEDLEKETQKIRVGNGERLRPVESPVGRENLYKDQDILEKEMKATYIKMDDQRLLLQLCYSIRQTCKDVITTFSNLTHEYSYQDIPDIRVLLFIVHPNHHCIALQCYIGTDAYFINCKHRFTLDPSKQKKLALVAQAWNSQQVQSFRYMFEATENWEEFLRESLNFGFGRDQIEHTKARIASSVAFPFQSCTLRISKKEHPIVICIDSTRKRTFPDQIHFTLYECISRLISDFNQDVSSPLEHPSRGFANDNGGVINQCNP